MQKVVLIDGNAIVHRAFHALPPFKTGKGELVNAVYGFTSMLLNIILNEKPDFIAVSFDTGRTFRHEEYKEYKATRTKAPDELYAQFARIREILAAFSIPIYEIEGYEADDVLGTLATQIEAKSDYYTLIATGDKDAFQLVTDKTQVLMPHKGFRESIIYTPEKVQEKMEIRPDQVPDFKGLCGDSSDNIKGVNGIGAKTATKLLNQYDSIEGIYEHLPEITGATHKKLESGKEDAFFSKRMATIVTDVPLQIDLDKCKTHEIDQAAVHNLFSELEFNSLIKRMDHFNEKYSEEIAISSGQQQLF